MVAPTQPPTQPRSEEADPEAPQRTTWDRIRSPLLVGAGLTGASIAVAAWKPGDGGTPICTSQVLFGVDCPLCGGLRCTGSLLRGDWLAAADHNVLLAVALPLAAVAWAVWLVASWKDRPLPRLDVGRAWWVAGIVGLVAFTLVRNSDANAVFAWLGSTAS